MASKKVDVAVYDGDSIVARLTARPVRLMPGEQAGVVYNGLCTGSIAEISSRWRTSQWTRTNVRDSAPKHRSRTAGAADSTGADSTETWLLAEPPTPAKLADLPSNVVSLFGRQAN